MYQRFLLLALGIGLALAAFAAVLPSGQLGVGDESVLNALESTVPVGLDVGTSYPLCEDLPPRDYSQSCIEEVVDGPGPGLTFSMRWSVEETEQAGEIFVDGLEESYRRGELTDADMENWRAFSDGETWPEIFADLRAIEPTNPEDTIAEIERYISDGSLPAEPDALFRSLGYGDTWEDVFRYIRENNPTIVFGDVVQ